MAQSHDKRRKSITAKLNKRANWNRFIGKTKNKFRHLYNGTFVQTNPINKSPIVINTY